MNNLVCKLSYSLDKVRTSFGAITHLNTIVTQITVQCMQSSKRPHQLTDRIYNQTNERWDSIKVFLRFNFFNLMCEAKTRMRRWIKTILSIICRLNYIWWFEAMAQPWWFHKEFWALFYSAFNSMSIRISPFYGVKIHGRLRLLRWFNLDHIELLFEAFESKVNRPLLNEEIEWEMGANFQYFVSLHNSVQRDWHFFRSLFTASNHPSWLTDDMKRCIFTVSHFKVE